MPLPHGWLLTTGGAPLRAPSLAALIEIGVERGLIARERRIAKTGDEWTIERPMPGVRVLPAGCVGEGGAR